MANNKIKSDLLKYNYSMICLVALIIGYLILKINLAFLHHEVIWDEAVYIGIGKYIYSLGEIGIWESIRPPGLPLLFGFLWKIDLPIILFSELTILLFGIVNIGLIYTITKQISNKKIALLASLLFTLTPIFFHQSSYILTHIPAISFALFAVYLVMKKRYFYSGIFTGVAFLFRYPQGALLIAICVYILIDRENKRNLKLRYREIKKVFSKIVLVLAGFLIIISPLLILNYIKYNEEVLFPFVDAARHQGNLVHKISNQIYNLFFYLIELVKQNPLLIFSFLGTYLFLSDRKKYIYPNKRIIITAFILPFLYYTAIINKQLRFSIEFLPYLSILASYGLYEKYNEISSKIVKGTFILAVLVLITVPLKINFDQYRWRTDIESETTAKVHKYFFNNNLTLPILTADPTFLAYSDVKAYSFYEDIPTALVNYNKYHNEAAYVVYNTEFYPCYNEEECNDRQLLFDVIKADNELIFNIDNFYIFRNNNYDKQ